MSSEPTRRKRLPIRWLTIGEVVGVAALTVAGLGYWDSHKARVQDAAVRAADRRKASLEERRTAVARQTFLLAGEVAADGERIRLVSVNRAQVIQDQTLLFPRSVRADPVETTGSPRVDASWLASGVKRAPRHRDGASDHPLRVPVGVVTRYLAEGELRTDRAVYEVGYTVSSRFLRGASVKLEGVALGGRGVGADLQQRIDGLWAQRTATPKPAANADKPPPPLY